jgi:hypothetical protein
VLLLKKAIHGLVQAGCNHFPSKADPSLFTKKANGDKPLSSVIIYDDDRGIIGTPESIKEVIEALRTMVMK